MTALLKETADTSFLEGLIEGINLSFVYDTEELMIFLDQLDNKEKGSEYIVKKLKGDM